MSQTGEGRAWVQPGSGAPGRWETIVVPAPKQVETTTKTGTGWNPQTKQWEKSVNTSFVPVKTSFYQDSKFADGSVRQGGYFYPTDYIPPKGYEEPTVYVPSEFEAPAARVGVGGGLNRTVLETEMSDQPAHDPNYVRPKKKRSSVPKWPFMYLQGVK